MAPDSAQSDAAPAGDAATFVDAVEPIDALADAAPVDAAAPVDGPRLADGPLPTPDAAAPDGSLPDAALPVLEPDAAPAPEPDAALPLGPEQPEAQPAREVDPAVLLPGPVTFVAALPGGYLAAAAGGLLEVPEGGAGRPIGPMGEVRAALRLDPATLLLAGPGGLFVLADGLLQLSPLGASVGEPGFGALALLGSDLWLAGAHGLYLWREERLLRVQPAGLPSGDARLAADAERLWVASGGVLYALVAEPARVLAWPEPDVPPPDALTVDGEGTLWVAAAGDLHRRDADGTWRVLRLPAAVVAVDAHAGAPDLWIVTDAGLWHHRAGLFRPVHGAPASTVLATEPRGSLLIAGDAGLVRVVPGRYVALDGVAPDAVLDAPARLEVRPDAPDHVTAVELRVDGEARAFEGADWAMTLDPVALGDGPHAAEVTVRYDDAEPAVVRLRFSVRARRLAWSGLAAGAVVDAPREVGLEPDAPEHVVAVQGGADGASVAVEGPPWRLAVDPVALGDGEHTLSATVTYADTAPVSGQLRFTVRSRRVALVGIEPGAVVDHPVELEVRPDAPRQVAAVHGPDGVLAAPWRIAVDPPVLGDGAHSLRVTVDYADAASIEAQLDFRVRQRQVEAGLAAGVVVGEVTTIALSPDRPERVSALEAGFDGPGRRLAGPPWRLRLDPDALGEGAHALQVAVRYDDGAQAALVVPFTVEFPPPTWSADVGPLFDTRCGQCHGPRGFAHRIAGAVGFRAEIDAILAAVRAGRMPLPPNPMLSAGEIQLLEDWRAAGFPE